MFIEFKYGDFICASLYSFVFFIARTMNVGLGQEIPMWKAVALLRIPLAERLESAGKQEAGRLMHLVIPLIGLLQLFKGVGGGSEGQTTKYLFSQRGTKAQHSWHCHWPANNPYFILCAERLNGLSV